MAVQSGAPCSETGEWSVFAMRLGVVLGGFAAVMRCMCRMAMRAVRMMRGLLVIAVVVMLGGLPMVMGRVVVVLRGGAMMIGALVNWHDGLPVRVWVEDREGWRTSVTAVLQISHRNRDSDRLRGAVRRHAV